jgi:hypothetical protein
MSLGKQPKKSWQNHEKVRKFTYCCLAWAQSGGSFAAMEKLRKLQRRKKEAR